MIVIDSDNYKASGIETLKFSGGEPYAKVPRLNSDEVLCYFKMRTWDDVGYAWAVLDSLRVQMQRGDVGGIFRFIPYWPGARADRSDGLSPRTALMMEDVFGSGTQVFDLHNPECGLRLNKNWMPFDLDLPMRPDVDVVIAPDKGAVGRANQFRLRFCPDAQLVCATKERDPSTGRLSNYRINLDIAANIGAKCLVVDDICDGGGTFNLLGKAVHAQCPDVTLELFVSHGIFSKGLTELRRHYKHFYTTDSFYRGMVTWFGPAGRHPQPDITAYPLNSIVEKIAHG